MIPANLQEDFLVGSPDQGCVLAHCAATTLGLSFPLHTERAGLNYGQALLPLTVLDSKFLKGKGADVTVSRPWLVSGDSEHLARAAFYLILSIAL